MSKKLTIYRTLLGFALLAICGLTACDDTGNAHPEDTAKLDQPAGATLSTGAAVATDGLESDGLASDASSEASIIFGGGCFWCVEAVFEEMDGVTSVVSGYAGGENANPSYQEVCTGRSGHAEVCEIAYDPNKVELVELLSVFFKTHDPTTLNRQGADSGTQYRSTIMYKSDAQKQIVEDYVKKLDASGEYDDPIVTIVEPAPEFYVAEAYHQDYFRNNPGQGYCLAVISPKIKKFRDAFPDKRKKSQ